MRHQRPHIGIQIANARFLRFFITTGKGEVWTGKGWSGCRKDALLYAHVGVVQQDARELKRLTMSDGDK
jgi:ABC-type uncharacterized transport system YnjBCD ATPase subunit